MNWPITSPGQVTTMGLPAVPAIVSEAPSSTRNQASGPKTSDAPGFSVRSPTPPLSAFVVTKSHKVALAICSVPSTTISPAMANLYVLESVFPDWTVMR